VENLRLGEAPFDLNGQHRLLNFAVKRAVRGEKQVARQLHGQSRSALHLAARLDVAIRSSDDAPEIHAGVAVEILVFDGDQRVAQHRREIVITGDDAPLQGKRADDSPMTVIDFGDRTGTVSLERVTCGRSVV